MLKPQIGCKAVWAGPPHPELEAAAQGQKGVAVRS
jgi:hypothetical protein